MQTEVSHYIYIAAVAWINMSFADATVESQLNLAIVQQVIAETLARALEVYGS